MLELEIYGFKHLYFGFLTNYYTRNKNMGTTTFDEKNLTLSRIESLALSGYQRRHALATLARAEALVNAVFGVLKLWKRGPKAARAGTTLKPQ